MFYEYSEKELAMFETLGFTRGHIQSCSPVLVYMFAADKCFTDNISGPAVESLRRCKRAWNDNKGLGFRMTPEWDALINLE